nr:allophanate hydrolase subunit 1 [Pseudolysinimonas kribbensis]
MRRAGDRAVLVEPGDAERLARLRASLAASTPDLVTDWVVGARTVLLTFDGPPDLAGLEREVASRMAQAAPASHSSPSDVLTIPVRYDGPDLDDVARLLALTPEEVIAAHTGTEWVCRFIGFAPGFGYLSADGEPPFRLPRRTQSRPVVPAGSVALADEYTAVYPRRSPGGWQLIGTTDLPVWDAARTPPNAIAPGTRVRFVRAEP